MKKVFKPWDQCWLDVTQYHQSTLHGLFNSTYKNVLISEEASCAIVKFLEIESTKESSAGLILLSTNNLLSMGSQALIVEHS